MRTDASLWRINEMSGVNLVSGLKNIVYFLDFADVVGGSNKVLLTQAYIMKQRGYRVRMVIPGREGKKPLEELYEICERYGLETVTAHYTVATCMENIDILKALGDYKEIVGLLAADRPDIVHSAQLNIAAELAARDLGIPHLMNIYQVDEEAFYLDWLGVYPRYHSADSYLFARRWGKGLEIPSRCIRVAYEGDESNGSTRRIKDHITVLSIGVFCEHKNQLEILKFVLQCKNSGRKVKLIFLGADDNAYGKKCREFVKQNELSEEVTFEGFVLNIEDYFREADLFILASKVESYPGVIVESMANKIPIISTPVAGVPELLVNKENGFLSKGYKACDLCEAFWTYMDFREKDRMAQIVENAYTTYLDNHTYAVVGDQLDDYYRWIIKDHSSKKTPCLTAGEIENIFQKTIVDRNLGDIEPQTKNLIWFLYHAFSAIEQKDNKKMIIWGAGLWGSRVLEWVHAWKGNIEFAGFIDLNKQGTHLGYSILEKTEDAIEESGTIIVAMRDIETILEIMHCLDMHKKVRNKDYFLTCNAPIRI